MDSKLTTMDLAQALVRRSNIPAAEATAFIRQFFDTIHDGLLHERLVKVRNLGTFKLVGVDTRESVSVFDGSRIQIASHTKVNFSPDAVLRDAVNKPFAEFETVILSDDLDLADLEAIDASASLLEPSSSDVSAASPEPSLSVSPAAAPAASSEPSSSASAVDVLTFSSKPSSSASPADASASALGVAQNCADSHSLSISEETQITSESSGEAPVSEISPSDSPASDTAVNEVPSSNDFHASVSDASDTPTSDTPASDSAVNVAPRSSASVPNHGFWHCFFGFLLGLLLFIAGYCIGYLRPFALPLFGAASSAVPSSEQPSSPSAEQPSSPSAKLPSSPSVEQPSAPSAEQPSAPSAKQPSAPSPSKESVSGALAPSASKVPSETLAYPQLEGGEYWIVGIKGTEIMKPGRTLLNFSLKYYKSKDFVPYICTMNDIKNPDVVPLNKELKIPELRKK